MFDETLPEGAVVIGDGIAWSIDEELASRGWSHGGLTVWHWCDHRNWAGRSHYDAHRDEYVYWSPAGVSAHELVSLDPLHLEPSLYWPDCCGRHGFIRDGRWVDV